jgi:ketosteroid isomerase-like protein
MSGLTKDGGTSSEELALIVHKGVQEFCRLFQTSQFDKMAQFYASDTTLMLPHRPVIRGADKLPVLFRELKESGLHDWRIEPNRIEQFGDTALEYGTYSAVLKQPNGTDIADTGKYLVVWRRQADGGWLIHADVANSDNAPHGV